MNLSSLNVKIFLLFYIVKVALSSILHKKHSIQGPFLPNRYNVIARSLSDLVVAGFVILSMQTLSRRNDSKRE